MASRHMKRCSMSLIAREIQIKTTMTYHLPPVKMPIISESTKVLVWMWRKGNPRAQFVILKTGAVTMESNMEVPQKLKTELLHDPLFHFWVFT